MDVFYLSQTIGGIWHFFISKHTIAVFQNDVTKCLAVRNFHRISAVKVLPKVLENIRCWFRNVKRFQILIWLFGGQFSSSLLWAYFNIARLSTLKGSFKLPTNIRCLFGYVKKFQKLWFFSGQTLRAWHTEISLVSRYLEIALQADHTMCSWHG